MAQEILTVMTRKGQITVPAAIRRALKLKIGDRVALSLRDADSGEAVLRPVRSVVEETYGIVPHDGPPMTIEEMRAAFALGLATDGAAGLDMPSEPS